MRNSAIPGMSSFPPSPPPHFPLSFFSRSFGAAVNVLTVRLLYVLANQMSHFRVL